MFGEPLRWQVGIENLTRHRLGLLLIGPAPELHPWSP